MIQLDPRRTTTRPSNFEENYYGYDPSLPAAIVALVLWALILVAIIYRSWRFKIWYLAPLVVGLVSITRLIKTKLIV